MTMVAEWDAKARRFVLKPTESNSKGNGNHNHTVYYHVTGQALEKLIQFAKEDGFTLTADTEAGRKAKIGKAVKQYVDVAIAELIKAREEAQQTEPEETKRGKTK